MENTFTLGEILNCRYADLLEKILINLGAKKILRSDYEADYQGHVDVDVLLEDGRVFSYKYSYGSCSGCDVWEARYYRDVYYDPDDDDRYKDLSDIADRNVMEDMLEEATFFKDMPSYLLWRKSCLIES